LAKKKTDVFQRRLQFFKKSEKELIVVRLFVIFVTRALLVAEFFDQSRGAIIVVGPEGFFEIGEEADEYFHLLFVAGDEFGLFIAGLFGGPTGGFTEGGLGSGEHFGDEVGGTGVIGGIASIAPETAEGFSDHFHLFTDLRVVMAAAMVISLKGGEVETAEGDGESDKGG